MSLSAQASFPSDQTYVLKLHRDASPLQGQLMGLLEHVSSGHQFRFESADQLLECLKQAASLADPGQ